MPDRAVAIVPQRRCMVISVGRIPKDGRSVPLIGIRVRFWIPTQSRSNSRDFATRFLAAGVPRSKDVTVRTLNNRRHVVVMGENRPRFGSRDNTRVRRNTVLRVVRGRGRVSARCAHQSQGCGAEGAAQERSMATRKPMSPFGFREVPIHSGAEKCLGGGLPPRVTRKHPSDPSDRLIALSYGP